MEKIKSELVNVKRAAIGGHVRPDGDCVGSCMGLYLYLKENYPEIETHVYLEQPRESFSLIKDIDEIRTSCTGEEEYDVFFLIDTSTSDRIGVAKEIFRRAKRRVCIDHHVSNMGFADVNIIRPDVSSASEVIFELLDEENISAPAAEAIYMGMVHDTGVFKFSSTTPRTMEIAGRLMGKGIDFTKIVDETFFQKSYVQNQILGRCLMESILLLEGRCIIGMVRKKDMEFYGVEPKDMDGIVDQLRITKGVEVAMFLYEVKSQEFKVSLRSNGPVDVNEVAGYFAGGGHVMAAGCTMQGSVYDVINNLMKPIEMQIKEKCCD